MNSMVLGSIGCLGGISIIFGGSAEIPLQGGFGPRLRPGRWFPLHSSRLVVESLQIINVYFESLDVSLIMFLSPGLFDESV